MDAVGNRTSQTIGTPETLHIHLYTVECSGDPMEEFKAFVEQNGLTGLRFVLIWDSELLDEEQPTGPYWIAPVPGWTDGATMQPIAERPSET